MDLVNLKLIYQKIKDFSDDIKAKHISEHSAQCAYYTILSFIPFVILLITLIQYTNIEPQTVFNIISKIVPESMQDLVLGIIQEVYSKSIGTISVSALITLWSAGKGLFALTKGLQSIYNTNNNENASYIYLRIKSLIGTVFFIVLIVLGLVVLVFGETFVNIIKENFGGLENFNALSSIFTSVIFTIIIMFIFMLLYKFMPKHKVTLKSQFLGAIFGALSLNVVSFLFSKYLYIFKGFSITYGSLTALMLIIMWVYSCFYMVFLGAEINVYRKKLHDNDIEKNYPVTKK